MHRPAHAQQTDIDQRWRKQKLEQEKLEREKLEEEKLIHENYRREASLATERDRGRTRRQIY